MGTITSEMINKKIKDPINMIKTDDISDGYHSFGELYKHRTHLFIALCSTAVQFMEGARDTFVKTGGHTFTPKEEELQKMLCTKTKVHNDGLDVGEEWGMFLLKLETPEGPVSYHLDLEYWDKCDFATELSIGEEFDGHTPDDVLDRLLDI